jgi:hypothetical protein
MVRTVQATDVFVIEPSKEATQNVESNGCQSITGNVSAIGGNIDFYITDPSGTTLLCYENILVADFNISTTQNGTYILHMVNRWSLNNITVELSYGRNFVVLREWHTLSKWTMTASVSSPLSNPWIGPLVQVALIVFSAIIGPLLVNVLSDEIRRRLQKWRDGEPKTPVVSK